jgi:phosphate transport system substrate-binding protein
MIKKVKQALYLALSVILITSCNQTDHAAKKDTSTSGRITIAADESLKPIIEAEEEMFEALYPNAQINISLKPLNY